MSAPRIVSRREWGAATTVPGGRHVPPSARRFFVVHWPVMGARDERQWCRDIERMHRNQGWGTAPGYNFLVGQSGTIYEGCGRDVRGIHSPPRNTDGWGVCVLQPSTGAGRPTEPISQAARNAARGLYDWLGSVAGRRLEMWWHGRDYATACPGPDLIAWVRSGMPATGGVTPPTTPTPEDFEVICSETAANGAFHVWMVGPQRRSVWFTVQPPGSTSWGGGGQGRVAGWSKFWDAPSGRTIRGVTACRSQGGSLHFWATLDDGSTSYCWQRPNESQWRRQGTGEGRLGPFAPAP
jgi:hypothetical protein